MVNTHTAAFKGNDLIVFIHQTESNKNSQQDAHRGDLSGDQRQFELKKQKDPGNRKAGVNKFVDVFKKINGDIYNDDSGQNDAEML